MTEKRLQKRYEQLKNHIATYAKYGICVAFSGGVDSSLILKAACDTVNEWGRPIYAVTFQTKLHPQAEITEAKALAKQIGAKHYVIEVDEFQDPVLTTNPIDRCYRCKKMLFTKLFAFAKEYHCKAILEGSNADDAKMYRPGLQAVQELGAHSPLRELAFHKPEIRAVCNAYGVESCNKPSAPCLATRLPYGAEFDFDLLRRIAKAEEYIKSYGFYNVRVRYHEPIARIEVDIDEVGKIIVHREAITAKLKELGFTYVTIDLEGFRSGSMDTHILSNDEV